MRREPNIIPKTIIQTLSKAESKKLAHKACLDFTQIAKMLLSVHLCFYPKIIIALRSAGHFFVTIRGGRKGRRISLTKGGGQKILLFIFQNS